MSYIFSFLTSDLAKEARGRRREVPIEGRRQRTSSPKNDEEATNLRTNSHAESSQIGTPKPPTPVSDESTIIEESEKKVNENSSEETEESLLEYGREESDATAVEIDNSDNLFEDEEMEE